MLRITHQTNPPDTAEDYYVVLTNELGLAYRVSTGTAVVYNGAQNLYAVVASHAGNGLHTASVHLPIGQWFWNWYKEATPGSQATSDPRQAIGQTYYNGVGWSVQPEFFTTIANVISQLQFDFGVGPERDNALTDYLVRISHPTAGDDGGFVSSVRRVTAHDYDSGVHTVTLESAPAFTITAGCTIEFNPPGGPEFSDIISELIAPVTV